MLVGDQEESQRRHQTTKVKPVECRGRLLESCKEVFILVIEEEMNLVANQKVDLVEEQIVGGEGKGNVI